MLKSGRWILLAMVDIPSKRRKKTLIASLRLPCGHILSWERILKISGEGVPKIGITSSLVLTEVPSRIGLRFQSGMEIKLHFTCARLIKQARHFHQEKKKESQRVDQCSLNKDGYHTRRYTQHTFFKMCTNMYSYVHPHAYTFMY